MNEPNKMECHLGRENIPLLYLIPTLSKVPLCVRGRALPPSCHYKPRKYTVIIIS